MDYESVADSPIKTFYYQMNPGVPIGLAIVIVAQIVDVLIAIYCIPEEEVWCKWLLYFICSPFVILLAVWPYFVRIIYNQSENTITFRWMSVIPFIWICRDKKLQIPEINIFRIELNQVLNKRYFKIYAQMRDERDDILVIYGQDQSCSMTFSDKPQRFTDDLNTLIRTHA